MEQRKKRQPAARNTRQRQAILRCLMENRRRHVTVDDIVALLKDKGQPAGQATVYRTLRTFEADGLVKRHISVGGASACFQYDADDREDAAQLHLVCDVCGKLAHVEHELLDRLVHEVGEREHFAVDRRRLSFYGRCAACGKGGKATVKKKR